MMMTINQARGLRASDRDRVACICSRNTDTSRKRSGVIDVSVLATASRTRVRPDGQNGMTFLSKSSSRPGCREHDLAERFPLFGIMLQQLIRCRSFLVGGPDWPTVA